MARTIPILQYHATNRSRLRSIQLKGLLPPRHERDVSTLAHGVPSISTADSPADALIYHPDGVLLELAVNRDAHYLKRSARSMRRGERLLDAVNRWLKEAQQRGADGVYVEGWQSTVGNQTINPSVLRVLRVVDDDALAELAGR